MLSVIFLSNEENIRSVYLPNCALLVLMSMCVYIIFTVQRYASTVYAILCVCVSVTLQYCIKTAKFMVMQIMPHVIPGTAVF